jgi:DNA-binding MarR family transcriptional regulator
VQRTGSSPLNAPKPATAPADPRSLSVGTKEQALDERALMHLVGYATALAGVALIKPAAVELSRLDLRMAEFSMLALLDSNEQVNQKSLGETLAISPPNLAVAIDRLVEKGFVRRERNERDRRQQLIRLTPTGQQRIREAVRVTRHAEEGVLSALSAAERATLIELLHRVIRNSRKTQREARKRVAHPRTTPKAGESANKGTCHEQHRS